MVISQRCYLKSNLAKTIATNCNNAKQHVNEEKISSANEVGQDAEGNLYCVA